MANQGMKPSVYLETTIISYLTARPTRDLIMAANMQVTREWWESRREGFDLFVSDAVRLEASAGDADAARRRLEFLDEIARIDATEDAEELAKVLLDEIPLPPRADADALHLAIAAVNGLDYLLTWNCRHLANATYRPMIELICHQAGFQPPIICTPLELMEP